MSFHNRVISEELDKVQRWVTVSKYYLGIYVARAGGPQFVDQLLQAAYTDMVDAEEATCLARDLCRIHVATGREPPVDAPVQAAPHPADNTALASPPCTEVPPQTSIVEQAATPTNSVDRAAVSSPPPCVSPKAAAAPSAKPLGRVHQRSHSTGNPKPSQAAKQGAIEKAPPICADQDPLPSTRPRNRHAGRVGLLGGDCAAWRP